MTTPVTETAATETTATTAAGVPSVAVPAPAVDPCGAAAAEPPPYTAWVVLEPLDVVSFRDGRPFSAGLTATARTTMPLPTAVGGASRVVFGVEPDEVRGPVLVDLADPATVLLPAPFDLVVDRHRGPRRLHPETSAAAGVTCDLDGSDGVGPAFVLPTGTGEVSSALLRAEDVASYLAGDPGPALESLRAVGRAGGDRSTPVVERRLGITRHPRLRGSRQGRTTQAGFLYLAEFLRPPQGREDTVGFACQVAFRRPVPPVTTGIVPFGGEARQAEVLLVPDADPDTCMETSTGVDGTGARAGVVRADRDDHAEDSDAAERADTAAFASVQPALAWPSGARVPLSGAARGVVSGVAASDGVGTDAGTEVGTPEVDVSDGRVLVYLATPAVFAGGWLPPLPVGAMLVAACTRGPRPVASWAPRERRARPLRWAVEAGSVYFLRFDDPGLARDFAVTQHGRCLRQADERLRTCGFGLCLVGRW